jgi:hypothetical protein
MTNQNEYSLTIGMKTKTLTIASSAKLKEVNDAKLIATSPGCSRMARQAIQIDRERAAVTSTRYHSMRDARLIGLTLGDYFILLG